MVGGKKSVKNTNVPSQMVQNVVTAPQHTTTNWPEIARAHAEKRCDLVLSGRELINRQPSINCIQDDQLFIADSMLNFLEISGIELRQLNASISRLSQHLTRLVLHSNLLTVLPAEIGLLHKLKLLDVSANQLSALPAELGQLSQLASLNASNNRITNDGLPSPQLASLTSLADIDLSSNLLTSAPSVIFACATVRCVNLAKNQIVDDIDEQSLTPVIGTLKTLDLSSNRLNRTPFALLACVKLKDVKLSDNAFKDGRFNKLVNDPRLKGIGAIVDYLKRNAPKTTISGHDATTNGGAGGSVDGTGQSGTCSDTVCGITVHVPVREHSLKVTRMDVATSVRPFIACCIVRHLSLGTADRVKLFLSIQNKLHDGDLCRNRTLATIATHDFSKVTPPLSYTARSGTEMMITPLHKSEPISAIALVASLTTEAEMARKREKRSTYSPLYKYLNLVKNKTLYSCLVDANNVVISFAPVTNSDLTKISDETTAVLIEVSSSESANHCRRVMDKLIGDIFEAGFAADSTSSLYVEQVRVDCENGDLFVAYPDKNDLKLDGINVHREYAA